MHRDDGPGKGKGPLLSTREDPYGHTLDESDHIRMVREDVEGTHVVN